MDIIKVKFDDQEESVEKLPDVSEDMFTEHVFDTGLSDMEYNKYKRENGMVELTDFNGESTKDITLIVEESVRGRVLKFRCIYDSDNDPDFNQKEYFKEEG